MLQYSFIIFFALTIMGCHSHEVVTSVKNISVHGHRGSRGTHPENSLPAFEEALNAGVQVLEFDLQMTKDEKLVVAHDPQITGLLCRDKNGKQVQKPVYIRTLTLKQVKEYDCGSIPHEKFLEQQRIKTQIPSLDEVLTLAARDPKVRFNIETKMSAEDPKMNPDPTLFSKRAIETFRRHKVLERVVLQSFDFRTLEAAKILEPKLTLSCLFETEKDFCTRTQAVGAQIASPFHELLTREEIARCHNVAILVVPWTLNEPAHWAQAIELGVDEIITDYPRKLITYLASRT